MTKTINSEEVFKCSANSFAISTTANGYTLSYSVDGTNWTDWTEPVPAGEDLLLYGAMPGMSFKLTGNTEDLIMTY